MSQAVVERIPVTILTGFLGSGKSTLIRYLLRAAHGHRIAIVENEFGPENIDAEIIAECADERIVQLTNGCVCCSIRDDLREALQDLASARVAGRISFDRVILETTGLADPIPVAQTFFLDDEIARDYRPDAIVTMVDGKFAMRQLDEHIEAQRQVGIADRLFISKADLVTRDNVAALSTRLCSLNNHAKQIPVSFGVIDLAEMFNINGFDLVDPFESKPEPIDLSYSGGDCIDHSHDRSREEGDCPAHRHDSVESLALYSDQPLDAVRVGQWLNALTAAYGDRLMRYKGVVSIAGADRKLILQGVYQLTSCGYGAVWPPCQTRQTKLVFIGRDLPRSVLERTFKQSLLDLPPRMKGV